MRPRKCPVCKIELDGTSWETTGGPGGWDCSHLKKKREHDQFVNAWVKPTREAEQKIIQLRAVLLASREALQKAREVLKHYEDHVEFGNIINCDCKEEPQHTLARIDAFFAEIGEIK